jgi:hypothetical protein
MSIIHDALKKVQEGLSPKTNPPPENLPPAQNTSGYIYETAPVAETLPTSNQETTVQKPPIQNKIKSILALVCAMAITLGAGWYIYKQFQNDIPMVQRLAKKSFYKLIHKKEVPDFKTKTPEELVPLAQFTINAPAAKTTGATQPPAPITLDIHGIMSNPSGNVVLINDQVYQEGDEVGGAKIVKINLDSITVLINGTEETIHVKD